jgi:HEAT repeat protein
MKVKSVLIGVLGVAVVVCCMLLYMEMRPESARPVGREPEEAGEGNGEDAVHQGADREAEKRRGEVFRVAGESEGKDVSKLLPYLEDELPRVRLAAARTVVEKDVAGNFDRLVKLLRDEDGMVRASMAQLLAKTKNSHLIGEYAWIIQYDREDRVKLAALDGLKEVGEELCIPPMIEALQDESSVIRKQAARKLPEVAYHRIEGTGEGGEEAYGKWLEWWKEKKLAKYANHEGLQRLKVCNDVTSLLLIVESPDSADLKIRVSAVSVLSTVPGERARVTFRKCLHSVDEAICIAAINAVAAGKLTGYAKDLENLAKYAKSEAVRAKATQAILELQGR